MKTLVPFIISVGLVTTIIFISIGMWSALPAGTLLPLPFVSGNQHPPGLVFSIVPVLAVLVTLVFALAPKVATGLDQIAGRYTIAWFAVLLLLALVQGLVIRQSLMAL
ncbi:MAG: hypothetical protein PW791_05820 [Neorhizobium sp.]|nr:hypothetical protein [Neorhizobium sp.]